MSGVLVFQAPTLAATLLTPRQYRILDMIADGYTSCEIAAGLEVSIDTVRTHVVRLRQRAATGTRAGAVGWAYRQRIFTPRPADGARLTPREFHMVHGAARGLASCEIAAELGIATETVRSHWYRTLGLLQARTRAHAVRRAIDTGVLALVPREAAS